MIKRITNARRGASVLMTWTGTLLLLSTATALAQTHSMNHDAMDLDSLNREGMKHGSMAMDGMTMPSGHDTMKSDAMNYKATSKQPRSSDTAKTFAVERMTYAETGEGDCEPPIKIDPTTGAPACWPDPMMDEEPYGKVLIDQLELGYTDGADSYSWEGRAYWGDDYNKIAFETEGEGLQEGEVEAAEVQLLYSRLISPFFDIQAGIRYDLEPEPERAFAVLGLQGLAPYWFEVEADLYLSEDGDLSFHGELEYELLVTQRLILTPSLELTLAAQDMPKYGTGRGLTSTEIGLRLRYAIQRKFAPYIGVSYQQLYGDTKDYAESAGEETSRTAFVVGLRVWF